MKNFFENNHRKIDVLSIKIFLYSVIVIISIKAFDFIENEYLYAAIVLIAPLVVINRKFVNIINDKLHAFFGFRR